MSAHAESARSGPALVIRGRTYPILLPKLRDPRLHLGLGHHLAADPRPGRVRLQAVDRADPRRPRHVRRARDGDRVPEAARDPLAGERAADRQRRRVHPPRPRDGARRLVEHERLVDLRRNRCRRAALEVRDRVARPAPVQPVELRARPLLPDPRQEPRVPTRVLVGADDRLDGARARDHRRRRTGDPLPAPAALHRDRLLALVRRRDHRRRAQRPRDDDVVASRRGDGHLLLVGADHVAGDPRLHVLHDHRPEDDSARPAARGSSTP